MKIIEEKTALIQTSELRTQLDLVLSLIPKNRVILEKRHKPVAVIVDPEKYDRMEKALEHLSDIVLALEAWSRESRKPRKTLTLEEMKRRLGFK